MKNRTINLMLGLAFILLACGCLLLLINNCNGNPDPPPPESCVITVQTISHEDGTELRFLQNEKPITDWIFIANGFEGSDGAQGIPGVDGKDCTFPDSLWMKEVDRQGESVKYAVSDLPLPPTKPTPDTIYIKDVILEDGEWAYILRGDSLKLRWIHGYKDLNGRPIDPADLFFHVAYENRAGEVFSLKPFENVTQDTFLVMYGLPLGTDIIPAVSAFRLNNAGERRYSTWVNTLKYEYFVRRE